MSTLSPKPETPSPILLAVGCNLLLVKDAVLAKFVRQAGWSTGCKGLLWDSEISIHGITDAQNIH